MNTLIITEAVLIIKGETTVQLRISAVLLRKAGRWDVPYAIMEITMIIEVVLLAILVLLAFKYEQNTFFNNKIIYLLGEYSGTLYVVHTCLLQIPHYIWPNTWKMQYFM